MANILIVEARFYEDMADALVEGAQAVLEAHGHAVTRLAVPGVLEIPPAIKFSEDSGQFDGYVALGVVIRGETSHYDIVCGESARGLMNLAMNGIALGNGIQTVENAEQAWARCRKSEKDKGGGAAAAALRLLDIKSSMQGRA